jgi:uncharacterized protein with PQ loop repeat
MNEINYNSYILFNRLLEETTKKNYKNIFTKLSIYGMDCTMILAPLLTYFFQIIKFYKTKSSKGFSKYICLLLFLANILRIFFWYGIHFKNVLLYQSIGVSSFQIILIHLCIKFQEPKKNLPEIKNINENNTNLENKNNINLVKNFIFAYFSKTFKPKYFKWLYCSKICNPSLFWNWPDEKEYYKFMTFITLLFLFLCSSFKKYKSFFQLIGIFSALFETFICVPQVVTNCRTKFTKNISFMMIICWLIGDSFRLFYNINYSAPKQLIIGIMIQLIVNSIVLIQLILYRNNNFKEKERINSNKKQIEEINQLMKSIDELNVGK